MSTLVQIKRGKQFKSHLSSFSLLLRVCTYRWGVTGWQLVDLKRPRTLLPITSAHGGVFFSQEILLEQETQSLFPFLERRTFSPLGLQKWAKPFFFQHTTHIVQGKQANMHCNIHALSLPAHQANRSNLLPPVMIKIKGFTECQKKYVQKTDLWVTQSEQLQQCDEPDLHKYKETYWSKWVKYVSSST